MDQSEEIDVEEDTQDEADEEHQQQQMQEHHHQQIDSTAHQPSHGYSIYEPHYQQMHPLIYYEEPAHHHHPHAQNHHHHQHQHILSASMAHNWADQEHYVHMPMMIPYGDTSARVCYQTADGSQPIEANEIVVTSSGAFVSGGQPMLEQQLHQQAQGEMHSLEVVEGEQQQEHLVSEDPEQETEPAVDFDQNHGENQQQQTGVVSHGRIVLRCKRTKTTVKRQAKHSAEKDQNLLIAMKTGTNVQQASRFSEHDKRDSQAGSPAPTNRELHNEIERKRRSRIKNCCEILRGKIPGLNDKTDKATVLEYTVKFINHLANCPNFRCRCETSLWNN